MPSLDLGGVPVALAELQQAVETFSVESTAQVDQQHDSQGAHTDITANSIAPNTSELIDLDGGVRFGLGPIVYDGDGNDPGGSVIQPAQITANQNNYDPPFLAQAAILELESDAARTITGLVTIRRRRALTIINRGNFTITFAHNSGSSTAQYRFFFSALRSYDLRSGGRLDLYYDAGSEIWRGESGADVGYRVAVGTDPAAGAEFSETVPTGQRWAIFGVQATLQTNGNVANRTPSLIYDDGATTITSRATTTPQTASQTLHYNWPGTHVTDLGFASNMYVLGMPLAILEAGSRIRSSTANLQAGDNWGAPKILYVPFDV